MNTEKEITDDTKRQKLISVCQFCKMTSISRATFYREVRDGRISFLKCGNKTLIPYTELEVWIGNLKGVQNDKLR